MVSESFFSQFNTSITHQFYPILITAAIFFALYKVIIIMLRRMVGTLTEAVDNIDGYLSHQEFARDPERSSHPWSSLSIGSRSRERM
jgi:hypothetical protein